MFRSLLRTNGNAADLMLRVALGAVFFPHGAQKVLGIWGGYGLEATMGFFTRKMGVPAAVAALVIAAEFLGSVGLILGFLTRVAALGIFCVMAGAIYLVHAKVGFFMNWFGQYPAGTEGFEFHLLALAASAAVIIRGAGPISIDRRLAARR